MSERMRIICPECNEKRGLFKVFLKKRSKELSSKGHRNVKTLVCNSCEHMIIFTEVE